MAWFKKLINYLEDRTGIGAAVKPLLDHLVPPKSKWSYVFGSATLFCFLLQVVTGIGLSFLYEPSSADAYHSLQYITNQAYLGNILRGIHYYGASGMILFAGIHLIRVYITAAYKYPREINWVTGVILLFLTVAMGFTGQLLRWDSNGVWSTVVAAEQAGRVPIIGTYLARVLLGGPTIGDNTLSRFFAFHVFAIPALMFLLIGLHLFLVIRNGISEPPKAGRLVDPKTYKKWYDDMLKKVGVPFWPNAAWRDALFGACVILAIIGLAIVFGPPALTKPPDPSSIDAVPEPDWYMIPFFAVFALMPPKIGSYIIFFGPLFTILIFLSVPFISNRGERHAIRRPWAVFGVLTTLSFIFGFMYLGYQANWSPHFDTPPLANTMQFKQANLENGLNLFYKKGCQYCHRINGVGGKRGPDLSLIARSWNPQQLKVQITNGALNMPAYGGILTKNEMNDIVSFLMTRK